MFRSVVIKPGDGSIIGEKSWKKDVINWNVKKTKVNTGKFSARTCVRMSECH